MADRTAGKGKLYTAEILGLAVELARYPLDASMAYVSEASSKTCGSTLRIGLACRGSGGIEAVGMQVSACAIGQASAAIFARHVVGHDTASIINALSEIERWLEADGRAPSWAEIEILDPARAYPARHGAILLPWKAAVQALSKPEAAR